VVYCSHGQDDHVTKKCQLDWIGLNQEKNEEKIIDKKDSNKKKILEGIARGEKAILEKKTLSHEKAKKKMSKGLEE
jgi:hypothetical protein